MSEFRQFVTDTQQFFWALVALSFIVIAFRDFTLLKTKYPRQQRVAFFSLILLIFFSVLGLLTQSWGAEGLFFSFSFATLITLALCGPKYAVGFLLLLLLSRPWENYTNQLMMTMPRDISILSLLSILAYKLIRKQYYFRFNPGTLLLLAFAVWMFMSGFFSNHVDAAMLSYSEIFSKGVILFILIQNSLDAPEDLFLIKVVFVIAILEKCFISFWKTYVEGSAEQAAEGAVRLESVGILSNSNDIAAIFILAIPFIVVTLWRSPLRPFNWLLAVSLLTVMSSLVWMSQSRGALLGLFAIYGAWALTKVTSKKILASLLTFGLLATLGSFKLLSRDAGDVEGSTSNRILYWKAGLNMAIKNPIFGVGYAGFQQNLPAYVPGGDVGTEGQHMTAHSSWILALAEGGALALVLFVALWLYAIKCSWSIRSGHEEYFMAICGYGMAISFLSHTYLLYPYILLSIAITHAKLVPREMAANV